MEMQEVEEATAEVLATGGKAVVRLLKLDLGISLTTEENRGQVVSQCGRSVFGSHDRPAAVTFAEDVL
jgi:hypothetical protein